MEHPITVPTPIQPTLTGLDGVLETPRRPEVVAPIPKATVPREAAARPKGRRRYWSIRDLSRRLWLGRGYELLRELIRSDILPATRSARSWWVDDADVHGLLAAFDDRAGKVRAFRGLDAWLRERCWVVEATPEHVAALHGLRNQLDRPAAFIWRGAAY
ncbi:MAG: hypothetical protein ACRDI2_25120, partial [Chloroflexota bacterium]